MKTLTKISILVLLLLFNYNLLSQVPTNGLVAYYPFNGNANDQSGNGNNGIVNGATLTSDRFSLTNSAYYFNGINSYIQTPYDLQIQNGNVFTFTCWFFSGISNSAGIFLGCGSGSEHVGFGYYSTPQKKLWANCRNNIISDLFGSSILTDNTLYFATFVVNSTNVKFYLNGQYDGAGSFTVQAIPVSNARIGSRDDNWNIYGGILDDIRIYNRELTSTEIQALYHEGGWQQFTVTTSSNPVNAGTTSGGGVYNNGTNVLVVANPNNGYVFVNWTESGNVVSTNSNYQFTVTTNRNLVANFSTIPTLSVSPLYIGISSNSGTGSFTVTNTTGGAMNWTAVSNVSWINISSGNNGTNNGTINFNYQTNFGNSRVGTITVTATDATGSPQTVEVRQDKLVSVEEETMPTKFALYQNYPNPFNPSTIIKYQVPNQSYVVIKLFNSLGQEIRTLVNEEKTQGRYELLIDGSELVSGVYFCQMRTGNFVETKKIVLMK